MKMTSLKGLCLTAASICLGASGAWAYLVESTVIPSNGPSAGGNVIVVTNTSIPIGNGSDITNVIINPPVSFRTPPISTSTTNILGQGTNWVRFVAPAAESAGLKLIYTQSASASHGDPLVAGYYTYNPAGEIGHESYGEWMNLGEGIGGEYGDRNFALAADTNGNLYAGGEFKSAGGGAATNIAEWNGTTWTSLGRMHSYVNALALDTNGNLYAGGAFTNAGGVAANRIAKWDGTTWTSLGNGMNANVSALMLDTNGNLYAGGNFTNAGGGAANYIAKWNGTTWESLGSGLGLTVYALTSDTNGNLYAGGIFTNAGGVAANYIAKWDGTTWTSLGSGMNTWVFALTSDTNGNLYAGGDFTNAGGVAVNYIAKWNGTTWTNLGAGMNARVRALALDTDGNLYAGGNFTNAGGVAANYIAKWNGTTWTNLGAGMTGVVDYGISVYALTSDTNGNLYAGGTFTNAGGVDATNIAKWFETPADFGVSPSSGSYTGGYTVTISGTNLCNGIISDVTNVTLCGVAAAVQSVAGSTQIVVVAEAGSVGLGDVVVYSISYGTTIKSNAFTYLGVGMSLLGTNGAVVVSGENAASAKGTDFGNFTPGSAPVTNTFAVTNSGNATLNITEVTTNGSLLFQCSSIPASIAQGTASNFSIVFNPSVAGVATASVAIVNNSATTSYVLNLKGTVGSVETNLPTPVIASVTYGTYTNMVRVTWTGVNGATYYEILRNTTNDANGATVLADVPAETALVLSRTASATTLYYDDSTVVARQSYYYWVQALSDSGVSALSYVGMGYAELGSGQTVGRADLTVSDMVFLPVNLTNGSPAGTVSYRLANCGPDTLTAAPVRFDFYMIQGGQEAWIAFNETNVTLVAGAEQLYILNALARQGMRVRGDLSGQYAVQVRTRHLDLMADQHTGSNMTDAAGTALVRASGVNSPGRSFNDYDGDGKADVPIYRSSDGKLDTCLSGYRYHEWLTVVAGLADLTPAPGDYDGDGITDIATYNRANGWWTALLSFTGQTVSWQFGGPDFVAAPCDIDGDAKTDPMVYREADGYWAGAASSRGYVSCYTSLGETGFQPVMADYDGDGLADPAVYNRESGLWGIALSGSGYQLMTGLFGGVDYLPASADYDGDGLADPAIYAPSTAEWQVLLSGSLATYGYYTWWCGTAGNINGIPVPADYDGDGKADLAVYHQDTTGLWELFLSTQGYREFSGGFGGPEYQPATE